jgi:multiple sugar transport system ATP-binding protein
MNFLPPDTAARFALGADGEVGVRPEHVRLGEGEVEGEVVVVEPAGSEAYVHLDAAGARLVARVPPDDVPEPGTQLRVGIRPGDVHRFDSEGKRFE